MANYALCVGLNNYPGTANDLRGCLKDIDNFCKRAVSQFHFQAENIRQCLDRNATKAGIMSRLVWLRSVAKLGDHITFYYSGHGSQIATRRGSGEIDDLMECVCPYNFDGSLETAITDKDFYGVFGALSDITATFFFDSCHSGNIGSTVKGWSPTSWFKKPVRGKTYALPQDLAWRVSAAKNKGLKPRPKALFAPYGAFLEGCKSTQTSADAYIKGCYQGAFSYALNTVLDRYTAELPTPAVLIKEVNVLLDKLDYEQDPQVEGSTLAVAGKPLY